MPASPGSVSTMPAADLATSVAVETAIPLAQCRRIIGSVAAHADGVTAFLKGFDEFVLVLRQDAGEDRELLRVDSVGDRAGRAEGAIKSYCLRDDGRRRRRVARHHHGADAEAMQLADQRRRVLSRRGAESGECPR